MYLVYKRYEPGRTLYHSVFLLALPGLLVSHTHRYYQHDSSSRSLAKTAAATYATYWGTILGLMTAYRLSPFHPLAKFPGPFFAKLSKLYMSYVVTQGAAHEAVRRWHAQYGDVVRIGTCFSLLDTLAVSHKPSNVQVRTSCRSVVLRPFSRS